MTTIFDIRYFLLPLLSLFAACGPNGDPIVQQNVDTLPDSVLGALDIAEKLDESVSLISDEVAKSLAMTHHPVFDFDTDGCYPAAAVGRSGQQNGGLKPSGSLTGGCRSNDFLDRSNTYHRWTREVVDGNEYEAHLFELYFEKDQWRWSPWGRASGHRHDIEAVVIYFENGIPTHVGASAHGSFDVRAWNAIPRAGDHPKIVYHKDGIRTHAFRFAKSDEDDAENAYDRWVYPTPVSWGTMYGSGLDNEQMRGRLNDFDFGSASFKIRDNVFIRVVNERRPSGYPAF